MAPLLEMRLRAMIPYSTTSMRNGSTKNTEMVIRKKPTVERPIAWVRQTGTDDPSIYSTSLYSATHSMGLQRGERVRESVERERERAWREEERKQET